MDCRDLEHLLHPYLDGELVVEERARVDGHLSQCESCAKHVLVERQNLSLTRAALRASAPQAPEALKQRLSLALVAEQRGSQRRAVARWAAAAAALLIVAGVGHHQWRVFQRRLYEADAAQRHARQYPLEIVQPTPGTLAGWFDGKLDHAVTVPRFGNTHAAGARLLNVRDKQAAYIRYEGAERQGGQARQLGLFVYGDKPGDVDVGSLPQPDLGTSNGYNVVTWREGDVVYQLVTDLDEADVMQLLQNSPPADSLQQAAPAMDVRPASFQR